MEVSAKTEDRFCVVSVLHERIDAAARPMRHRW